VLRAHSTVPAGDRGNGRRDAAGIYVHQHATDHKAAGVELRIGHLRPASDVSHRRRRCQSRGAIAHYKVPRYVRFVESFPLTISGKVQKYLIREHLRIELNLVEQAHA